MSSKKSTEFKICLNFIVQVARQYEVMKIWASRIFPELSFETVMGRLFAAYHQD